MDDDIKSFVIDKSYARQLDRALANLSLGVISALGDVLGQSAIQLRRALELFANALPA
jgi:hypothetical protein